MSGTAPLQVDVFTDMTSIDGAGDITSYQWDFNGEANVGSASASYIFTTEGEKRVTLTVGTANGTQSWEESVHVYSSQDNSGSDAGDSVHLEDGLVVYYPFNGNANDESGNGRNGTVTGATLTVDRHGNPDSAFAFDGNDFILVPEDWQAFNIGSEGFTMSLWVRFDKDEQTSSSPSLIEYGGYSSNGWSVSVSNTSLAAALRSDTDVSCPRYTDMANHQNEWVHYAITYENGTLRAFRDGGRTGDNNCPEYYPATGYNLVIGASSRFDGRVGGIVAQIDEVRVYSRVLSDVEIATLAENEQALEAARKGTIFHANFEEGLLEPEQHDYGLDIDALPGDAIRVAENPKPDSVNDSERVMTVQTAPSPADSYTRAEYSTKWAEPFITNGHNHTYQWMVYFPEDFLIGMDEIRGDWLLITQFVTDPCGWRQSGFETAICYSGGIFNEARINANDYNAFKFQYRAYPNCNALEYTYPRGEWIKFTYDINWTTESNGHYALWANEALVGHAEGVRTLPEGFVDGTCDIRWKVGLYNSWTDSELDEIHYYIDNLELYLDGDLTTICPGCAPIE